MQEGPTREIRVEEWWHCTGCTDYEVRQWETRKGKQEERICHRLNTFIRYGDLTPKECPFRPKEDK